MYDIQYIFCFGFNFNVVRINFADGKNYQL